MKPTIFRILRLTSLIVALTVLFSSCTKRTVLGVRPGKVQIAGQEDDSKEIREKFTNRGYEVDEQGNIVADNNNLFSSEDNQAKIGNKTFGAKKEARLGGRDFAKKEYKTPEYLKRSSFRGTNERASESGLFSNETENTAREESQLFAKKDAGLIQKINPFGSKSFRAGQNQYSTSQNREIARAVKNSPEATGAPRTAGFLNQGSQMSVDDVKKMLNPTGYAEAKGL